MTIVHKGTWKSTHKVAHSMLIHSINKNENGEGVSRSKGEEYPKNDDLECHLPLLEGS